MTSSGFKYRGLLCDSLYEEREGKGGRGCISGEEEREGGGKMREREGSKERE